ncbi:MAG: glutamyl-tRNA reductase [Planctomycetota bacterium]|jgi:glutamyl-tRNA reductase
MAGGTDRVIVVGMSHQTAPLEVREDAAFSEEEAADFLVTGNREGVFAEAMLLSTCNRTELYAMPGPALPDEGLGTVLLRARRDIPAIEPGHLFEEQGNGAVRRLMRVTCGLDSMILGENEIAGQVREAHRVAMDAGVTGPVLDHVVPAALRISRRARQETAISRGVLSVPGASLQMARQYFSDLSSRRVLVVGAGEAGRLAAQLLATEHPRGLWISNRTPSRAESLAADLRAATWPFEQLDEALETMDVVITAVSAAEPVIDIATLRRVSRARSGRMLVLVDVGVPRNVDPRATDCEGVFLHDISALEHLIEENRREREHEVALVERLIDEALERVLRGEARHRADPFIRDLRRHLEMLRRREVEKNLGQFKPDEHEAVDRLTRSLLDKAFHEPMVALRSMDEDPERTGFLRRLFGLGRRDEGEGDR